MSKLDVVRRRMAEQEIDGYIVPSEDPHLSEYPPEEYKLRKHISGFTGSAGVLVVLAQESGLWTDSRYYLQAASELEGSGITLFKDGLEETPSYAKWICSKLTKGNRVAIDGSCFSVTAAEKLADAFASHGLILTTDVEPLWNEGVVPVRREVYALPAYVAGLSHREKREKIFATTHADALLLSGLDEVAWTVNLRGSDTPYNPVFVAYALVKREQTILFADEAAFSGSVKGYLEEETIKVLPYDSIHDYLRQLPKRITLSLDPNKTNERIFRSVGCKVVREDSPVSLLKACKNEVELDGFRRAMVKDGVALANAFSEIYERVEADDTVTELAVAGILLRCRSQQDDFKCESFSTIAGYGNHGAVVHYGATEATKRNIGKDSLLLVDSGGNYLHGTTDITRTFCFGTPTEAQRVDYTAVLKGHIAIARAIFPAGTQGSQLDALAKQFLWRMGADYGHGTGHGVGHFLCVHEGPQNIRKVGNGVALRPGMVLSDEPGLYREGKHGIRIENMVAVVPKMESEYGPFYGFETLTLFPYDRSLIAVDLLSDEELEWVNAYHERVRKALSPVVRSEKTLNWLSKMTSVMTR